jgi:uncharacterized protein YprB with RNaseH-like and TPR domain
VNEFSRGKSDRGYDRVLASIAEARQRLALAADEDLRPDFALLKRHGFERILLLDLETGGWAGSPVLLAGLLTIDIDCVRVRQLLARSYAEEPAVVAEVGAMVAAAPLVVTYNGKSFDMPMLADRAGRYRLRWNPPAGHLDLLHHARRAYRQTTPDCRLVTLEWAICHRRRLGDVAGRDIPNLLHRFARDGDPSAVVPVMHHNALDLVTLAELLAHLVPFPPGPRLVLDPELATEFTGESLEHESSRLGWDGASGRRRTPLRHWTPDLS